MQPKIRICNSLRELGDFLGEQPDKYVCLYLAHKTSADWDRSTSRVYMNQLWQDFLYIPIDIKAGDNEALAELYNLAAHEPRIVAINQTQPHKSNPVVMKLVGGVLPNVDTLVKDKSNNLIALNLNAPSFVSWLETVITDIPKYSYILLGVGGVGEPIARELARYSPLNLILIDRADKQLLLGELIANNAYYDSLEKVPILPTRVVLINAAGKEGTDNMQALTLFLDKYDSSDLIYIDLRPQLFITEVELAQKRGYTAYTGYGMNARNDYTLVEHIAKLIGQKPPSYKNFQKLVAAAS